MGNLRDACTDEEWEELEKRSEERYKYGYYDFLKLQLNNKTIDELKKIKSFLSSFYSDSDLSLIDQHIAYKIKYGNSNK